jgi:hypothetical protein
MGRAGEPTLLAKHVEAARVSGALTSLSMALNGRGMYTAWCGDFDATAALVAECDAIHEATGIGARSMFSAGGLLLAAYQGRPDALPLMSASAAAFVERGLGVVPASGPPWRLRAAKRSQPTRRTPDEVAR